MKYAVSYRSDFKYFDDVDEIIFNYKGTENIVDFIPKLLKKEQRANIRLNDIEFIEKCIPFLNKLKTVHSNFIVQIDFIYQKSYINLLQDNEIKFMFCNFAKTKEEFYSMLKLGAEDIYIVEELAFNLKSLKPIAEKYNVNIRVFPDVAQFTLGTREAVPAISTFFIRPEDIELYEEYVDIIEFFHQDDKLSTIYKIYKEQQWLGPLETIILGAKFNIDNTTINPHFGQWRINCQKKCMFEQCNLCMEIEKLATQFDKANIEIVKKKKKPELTTKEKEELLKNI